MPHLEFLVTEPLDAVVLSPNQVIPVKLPPPERFPGALLDAFRGFPATGKTLLRRGARAAVRLLDATETKATDALGRIAG